MKTVTIHVPYDSGFADGGSPAAGALLVIMNVLEWIFAPISKWKYRKKVERLRKEFEDKNVREGKNPDGSYSREFPAVTTLAAALTELGFPLKIIKELSRDGDNIVDRKGDVPIGDLTAEELDDAVCHCQISLW